MVDHMNTYLINSWKSADQPGPRGAPRTREVIGSTPSRSSGRPPPPGVIRLEEAGPRPPPPTLTDFSPKIPALEPGNPQLIEATPLSALLSVAADPVVTDRPLVVVDGAAGARVVVGLTELLDSYSDLECLDDEPVCELADAVLDLSVRHGLTGQDAEVAQLAADALLVAGDAVEEMRQDMEDMLQTPTGDVWRRCFTAEKALEALRDELDQALLAAAYLTPASGAPFLFGAIRDALQTSLDAPTAYETPKD